MNYSRLIAFIFLALGSFCLFSCENSLSKVDLLTAPDKTPLLVEQSANIVYNDSGKIKMRLVAPLIARYGGTEPVDSFTKGMKVDFYDDSMHVTSHVSANQGIMHHYKNSQLMEANNNVVVVNKKGEQLNTEQLFWDQTKHSIYTNKFVKITTASQILYGDGLVSNEDFSDYRIKNIKGEVMINNNQKK